MIFKTLYHEENYIIKKENGFDFKYKGENNYEN